MGPVKVWVVSDAEVAGRCSLPKARRGSGRPRRSRPYGSAVGENLFTQSDKAWAESQPLVAPAFRKKALDPRLAEMNALIEDEVAAIPHNTTIDLELTMGRIALILAAWVLLGEQLDRSRAEESHIINAKWSDGSASDLASSPASFLLRRANGDER